MSVGELSVLIASLATALAALYGATRKWVAEIEMKAYERAKREHLFAEATETISDQSETISALKERLARYESQRTKVQGGAS